MGKYEKHTEGIAVVLTVGGYENCAVREKSWWNFVRFAIARVFCV